MQGVSEGTYCTAQGVLEQVRLDYLRLIPLNADEERSLEMWGLLFGKSL